MKCYWIQFMSALIPSEKTHIVTLKALARPHATLELRDPAGKWASWQRNSFSSLGAQHMHRGVLTLRSEKDRSWFSLWVFLGSGFSKEACAYTKEHRNNLLKRYYSSSEDEKGKIAVSKQKQYPYKNIEHSWEHSFLPIPQIRQMNQRNI